MAQNEKASLGIRFLSSRDGLVVEGDDGRDEFAGYGVHRMTGEGFFAPLEAVADVRCSSVRSALKKAVKFDSGGGGFSGYIDLPREASLLLADVPVDEFDGKHSPMHDHFLDLHDGRLLVCVFVALTQENWDERLVESTITPMLERLGCTYTDSNEYGEGPFVGNPWVWNVRFEPPMRGVTVGRALEMATAVEGLLTIADRGGFEPSSAWDLICAGQVQALYGQLESDWLEVKVQDWDLSKDSGKIELAQDIARFANGDSMGILLVGLGTKRFQGIESIVRGPGLHFTLKDAQRHHQILDHRIYPPVEGLQVRPVRDGIGGTLLAFLVPTQPAELKPFLVHGVIVGSRVEGAFFSIVRRRGEHSIPLSPQALHAQIAAGRAFLRSGIEP